MTDLNPADRPSFEEACRSYPNRYTMEHAGPYWRAPYHHSVLGVVYYAPQFATDREWYDATLFPGEDGNPGNGDYDEAPHCHTTGQTWPLGEGFLRKPFDPENPQRAITAEEVAKIVAEKKETEFQRACDRLVPRS